MLHTNRIDIYGTGVNNTSTAVHVSDVHLEGSSLVFDDVLRLVLFYCISRYVQYINTVPAYEKLVKNVSFVDLFTCSHIH